MPSKRQRHYQFDPQSLDAQLAGIHAAITGISERMDGGFKATKDELVLINAQVTRTNGRVTALENFNATAKAKLAGVAAALGVVGSITWSILKALFGRGE